MRGTVTTFLDYLEQGAGASAHTITAYGNDLNQFLEHLTGRGVHSWEQVTREDILDFLRWLQEAGYAVSTVARKVAAVRSFFHFLIERGVLEDDPSATIPPPRVPRRLPRVLSPQEVERLLTGVRSSSTPKALRDRALLELLYATGLRVSEVIGLKVEDVDLEQATLRCRDRRGNDRVLPLTSDAMAALHLYLEKGRPCLAHQADVDALFVNHRGRPLTRQGLWLIVRERAEKAGIERRVTPHMLRHTFAARLLESGAELQEVQARLGHANPITTRMYLEDDRASEVHERTERIEVVVS